MNIVEAQNALHKIITWMKNSKKGRQEWELVVPKETCLKPMKLNTLVKMSFALKMILF